MTYEPDTLTVEALRAAGPPSFFERDTSILKARYVTAFEAAARRTLYPGQVEMFVIEVMAYAHSIFAEAAQTAILQNRALWAEGAHLHQVGANVSIFPLLAQQAATRLEFSLEESRNVGTVVPKGTRVSAGGGAGNGGANEAEDMIFSTVSELVIAAGDLTGEGVAIALEAGTAANDLLPGQIDAILDPVAYITSVSNTIASGGGADTEADERFMMRVVNAFERISQAGPKAGYREHVMSVNPSIVDVAVVRPEPGKIEIYPLMEDGVSSDAVDAEILAYLDPETIRPMGDDVSILKATPVNFDVTLTIRTVSASPELEASVELTTNNAFFAWNRSLGSQVAPSLLVHLVKSIAGVIDVEIAGLAWVDLAETEFAILNSLTINMVDAPNV